MFIKKYALSLNNKRYVRDILTLFYNVYSKYSAFLTLFVFYKKFWKNRNFLVRPCSIKPDLIEVYVIFIVYYHYQIKLNIFCVSIFKKQLNLSNRCLKEVNRMKAIGISSFDSSKRHARKYDIHRILYYKENFLFC